MTTPPYMKLYWGDYYRGTRHLRSAAEHGAYLLLIGALWDAGGKLPADDSVLARHALCSDQEWAAIKGVVLPFFRVVRGHITQKRVTEEMAKYESTIRKRKEAGKRGGNVRRGKTEENIEANASVLPTKPEPEPEPYKEDIPHKPPRGRSDDPPGFPEWWAAYPRKVARAAAARAYRSARKRATEDVLLDAVRRKAWPDDERFVPHAATWLNGDRWLDGALPLAGDRTATWTDAEWQTALRMWRADGAWSDTVGPPPGSPGCRVPAHLLVTPVEQPQRRA